MNSKSSTALITGASGGVAYELAKLFANDHHNLVLVARTETKLLQFAGELQHRFGISVKTVALDLTAPDAPQVLFDRLRSNGIAVDILVNNAGYGKFGEFAEVPAEESLTDSAQRRRPYLADQTLPRANAGARVREDLECGFHRGLSTWSADGCLLRHQSVCDFVFRGAGE
jgi:NAD(P)-dependent dehydrogenase (short-subunit alcohol dehydrogenase family)